MNDAVKSVAVAAALLWAVAGCRSLPGTEGASALEERIGRAPERLIETLNRRDNRDDYTACELSSEDRSAVVAALAELPPRQARTLRRHLRGICAVNNFARGADCVAAGAGDALTWHLVLSPQLVRSTLSDWLSFQEASAFVPGDPHVNLIVDCGPTASAVTYALLRESTKLVDHVLGLTAAADGAGQERKWDRTFVRDMWRRDGSLANEDLRAARISFFGDGDGPWQTFDDWRNLYGPLARSGLVSLWSAQSAADDLAEFAALWHLTERLGCPYRIRIGREWPVRESYLDWTPMSGEAVRQRAPAMAFFYQ